MHPRAYRLRKAFPVIGTHSGLLHDYCIVLFVVVCVLQTVNLSILYVFNTFNAFWIQSTHTKINRHHLQSENSHHTEIYTGQMFACISMCFRSAANCLSLFSLPANVCVLSQTNSIEFIAILVASIELSACISSFPFRWLNWPNSIERIFQWGKKNRVLKCIDAFHFNIKRANWFAMEWNCNGKVAHYLRQYNLKKLNALMSLWNGFFVGDIQNVCMESNGINWFCCL